MLSGLTRADVAMIVTRGQAWRDALHRDLAQLGLEWLEADSLMEDYSVGGMDLDLYWRAQRVVGEASGYPSPECRTGSAAYHHG